jgi:mono/diheme cytochrome c family protein
MLLWERIWYKPAVRNFLKENRVMKRMLAWAVAVLCLLTGYGLLKSAEGGEQERGKALYEERCMLCHGPKGDGKGPGAVALNPKPADYTKQKFWEDADITKKISEVVKNGKGQMRENLDLKPEDVQAIILYMTATFKPK